MNPRPFSMPPRSTLLALVVLLLVTLAPPSAADIKFCPRWRFSYLDQNFGEDGLKHGSNGAYGTTEASYAWAKVTRNGVVVVPGTYMDSAGCTAGFPAQAGTYTIAVRSYLRKPDGTMFYVKDGSSGASTTEITVTHVISSPPPATAVYEKWIGSGAGDPVPNAMAAASQFARESAIGIAAGAVHNIIVNSSLAQAVEFDAYLSTFDGVNDASWKYVIGHEVGHTIQHGLFGMLDHDYYNSSANSPVLVCNCSHIDPPYD